MTRLHYGMIYTIDYRCLGQDWDFDLPPKSITREPQVVTATINSALSRQREPESDPVRLQL